jgi:hypothetical protein
VTNNVGGIAELLGASPEPACLVAAHKQDLAKAIEHVLRDDDLANSLSAAARRAAGCFQPEIEKKAWLRFITRRLTECLLDATRSE